MNKIDILDIKATVKGAYTLFLKRYAGSFWYRRKWLDKTQWYSEEKLKELQLELLKKMISHSYDTVPYYHKLMDNLKIKPKDIQSLEDIKNFPIMKKADLIKIGDDIVSNKFNKKYLRTAHTGGTTGLPVPIRRDLHSIGNEHAFVRRQFEWAGLKMSDRTAYLEGRTVRQAGQTEGRLHYYDAAMKELTLSTFHLSPETARHYVDLIKSYRIKFLIAYPSAAYALARMCVNDNIDLKLNAVLTTSETLDGAKKDYISKVFTCKVFDYYGGAERVCYIHTCENGTYHVIPEYGLTELIPADPPNEDCCRVVSTGFWNMAMPLIRYDMGDLVQVGDITCQCRRNFPTIKRILGRDGNVITTPSGTQLGASAIEMILAQVLYKMYDMPVLSGQVIQESESKIVLEYVPTGEFTDQHRQTLLAALREKVPPDIAVDIRKVDKMNQTQRGKFLSFVMAEHH